MLGNLDALIIGGNCRQSLTEIHDQVVHVYVHSVLQETLQFDAEMHDKVLENRAVSELRIDPVGWEFPDGLHNFERKKSKCK